MPDLSAGLQSLPIQYQNVVRLAQDRHDISITPLQALAGGWSGAIVYLVSVVSQNADRIEHLVLKLDRKNEKAQSDEIRRHETAVRQSPPGFAERHLARMAFESVEADGAMGIFYSIAGQSLHRYKTLSAYENQSQIETIFAHTYRYLLNDWNVARTFKQAVHPTALLEHWLSFRLKPSSNTQTFLETVCRVPPDIAGFLIQGHIFPNPLAYARNPAWWGTARPIDVAIGLQHGDLNTNNILVKFAKDDATLEGFYLIDFALFKEQMPLLFDLRYLEMSYLILRHSQVSFAKLVDLVTRFGEADNVDAQQVPIDVAGVCAVIESARQVFDRWVETNHPSLHDDIWGQYWLAGVAAGLSYCHKPHMDHEERLIGLIYAAANLKRYSALFGVPAPTEAVQLYDAAQLGPDKPIGSSVLGAARSLAHHLPAQTTTFIGREAEVAAVHDLLSSPDVRLVTLIGPGGVGKTRLSLEVAASLRDRFPDGVVFVPLADITEPVLVVSKIARLLEVREGGNQPLLDTLKGYLHDKRLFMILDNFDQVVAATSVVAELLANCPHLKILVTSRILLQLRGEQEFPVPPLETPNAVDLPDLTQLGQCESVQLFLERARAANPKLALTPENSATIATICQRLDGLPLAIELAAARIKLLPPQAMLTRLDSRLTLLTGGARDLPARQQSLRNSLDLSYSLLREEEQTMFARLGVFVGGFTLEAAEAVCNPDGSLDVLEGVSALMNNSLLRSEEGANSQPRFRMLETIREYALEQLEKRGELAATQRACAFYYINKVVNEVGAKLMSPDSLIWLDWLESERSNIGMALNWGLNHAEAAKLIPPMMFNLVWFWYRRGYFSEGRTWTERLLALPLTAGRTRERAFALMNNTMLALWQSDVHAARAQGEEQLAIWQQVEEEFGVAVGLMSLGVVYINMGNDAAAHPLLKEAQALFKTLGNSFFYATTVVHLANVALGLGNPVEARQWLELAYAASLESGESWTISFALNNFGEVSRVQDDYESARRYYEQSEALLRQMGDKGDLARLICSLGYVAQREGNYEKAEAQFNASLAMFRKLGNKRGIVECVAGLASLKAATGSATQAAQLLGAAEALMAATGAAWWPADRLELERSRAAVQARLDEATFAQEWARGREMTLEQAIASALDDSQ